MTYEKVCERGAANGRTSRRDGSSQIIPRVVIDARTTTVSSSAREGRHKENRRSVYRRGLIATRCMNKSLTGAGFQFGIDALLTSGTGYYLFRLHFELDSSIALALFKLF